MLMPSQSPTSTTTIQTLPSDQQQQQEYVDTLNSQANSTVIKFRREKSMEFDDDTRFIGNINDDINNNHSTFVSTDEMIKLESNHSSPASSIDEDQQLVIQTPSSSVHLTSPTNSSLMVHAQKLPSNRRSARPSSNHRSTNENEHSTLINVNEPDPNVFLISSDTNSHNTIRKTKHDVKRFVVYIDEQFEERKPLHTVSAESLCRYLKHYFENTKKFDGTQYEPDTLRSFLLSIERYLKSKKYEYNLMESPLFQSCRQVIMTKREQWKKMGGGNHSNSHHHQSKPSLILSNIKNLTIFDRTKPDGLLLEMYVHITKLCQDKVLAIPQLLWSDIELIDEQYLICRQQKTENQTIRLYATSSQPSTCPVQAYRLYATHRPPQCNTPQSPFFLLPRTSSTHHIWYKTTAAAKTFEQVLQLAIRHSTLSKQTSSPSLLSNLKTNERSSNSFLNDKSSPISILNGKRTETRISSPNLLPSSKRIYSSPSLVQPLNLVVTSSNTIPEEDSGTASSSPTNSLSNDVAYLSVFNKHASSSASITNIFHKQSSSPPPTPTTTTTLTTTNSIWDESVTDILLTVAKQRDTRVVKINILRTFLEEKLGVVEFLCLYRGFKSEPKLTFYGTPWEHYQRFLPVLFTLLTLDNTTV
ncbi:unnamed protein product [Rotaria socialis]|uniref:ZMYM2-like/QRICH1 C-terminal domain-containing protein n=1 Tax=Rotaria socialis TaxID=392032 RepID=A0A821GYG7_9BILA|nr:unnamed protein product [Rotaria socialis]CAF3459020.1 unnamed protein product [Rotaria socialis]CAF4328043.1 unnamed protein product [Rotaria socialis]CAF4678683.1 unnamed protein product [Rotaria socialis]